MLNLLRLSLQFFADGGDGGASSAASGDSGQASGVTATVDAAQRLRELGVPESKIRKRASTVTETTNARKDPVQTETPAEVATAATTETPAEESVEQSTPRRMTWDEIKSDPEYAKEYKRDMSNAMQARLRADKPAKEALEAMAPAIELMARKYGLDPKNMDYKALADAINDDDAYYEQKALEMGTSVDTAKRVDQMERAEARRKEAEEVDIQKQALRNHFIKLEEQSEAMKTVFPSFDLRKELRNKDFARMVSPNGGVSVEAAYYAVHHKELQAASMQVAAQKTAERISDAIQSGSKRPDELGSSSRAPSVSTFDYRNATPAERAALKKRIYDAKARGEKVYPGQ